MVIFSDVCRILLKWCHHLENKNESQRNINEAFDLDLQKFDAN